MRFSNQSLFLAPVILCQPFPSTVRNLFAPLFLPLFLLLVVPFLSVVVLQGSILLFGLSVFPAPFLCVSFQFPAIVPPLLCVRELCKWSIPLPVFFRFQSLPLLLIPAPGLQLSPLFNGESLFSFFFRAQSWSRFRAFGVFLPGAKFLRHLSPSLCLAFLFSGSRVAFLSRSFSNANNLFSSVKVSVQGFPFVFQFYRYKF